MSECPASLVVVMLSAIKRQTILDGAISIGEMHFAVQCWMKVTILQNLKENGELTAHGLIRRC